MYFTQNMCLVYDAFVLATYLTVNAKRQANALMTSVI
jgi:hypothetical protein